MPDETWDIWASLNVIMSNDNNYAEYRKVIMAEYPAVPYIGVFLTDLVFIEDSQPDYKEDTNLINVSKLGFVASILFVIESCKRGFYDIPAKSSLQANLMNIPNLLSQTEQRAISLELEPMK